MNCPQCQERLDEQLDELRPGLRSGTLSPDDARTQAQQALAETVSQCAECEAELRAHLNLRLSLMLPDEEVASVAVPPALRANVRRALEREIAQRPYASARSTWNPIKSFAWTGGAVLSAIALFVVARPFLYEKATAPLPDTAASMSSAPADSAAPGDGAGSASPPMVKQGTPIKPKAARLTPSPQKPVPPPPTVGRTSPQPQSPSGSLMPPVLPTPRVAPAKSVEPPRTTSSGAPSPKIAAPPAVVSQAPSKPGDTSEKAGQRPNTAAPKRSGAAPSLSKTQPQTMRSTGPTIKPPAFPDSATSAPREPKLESNLLAPVGKALGLTVRFVPAASERQDGMAESRANTSSMYTAPAPVPAPQEGAPPAAVAPSTAKIAPPPQSPPKPIAPSMAPQRAMRQRTAPGAGTSQSEAMTGSSSNAADSALHDSDSQAQDTLSVSVNEEVTNARVFGQVQGREGKGVLLWSGNAPARKPISVPLEPLNANKGDTINISFQQQVSLGETKTLATTSIVIP